MQSNKYNRVQAINLDTGEVLANAVMKGNDSEQLVMKVVNEKQVKAIKKKTENKSSIAEHIEQNEGSFVHFIYKYGKPIMESLESKCGGNKANIHIIRFIQLATYSTFGGKLFDSNWNRIKRSSLKTIWDTTSKNSIKETYDLLIECGYIYETEEGYLMISDDLIVKGAIEDFKKRRKDDKDLTYTRLFSKNIQSLYEGTEPKSRKQLANLFKILPYINFKYNVFCENPTETNENELKLYTWTDLARICGVDAKNVTRFKKDLWNLKIYGHNTIGEFLSGDGKAICVNPKIYYSGDNIDDVRNLYAMFKMTSK